jgi:hypothetical protein
MHMEEIPHVPWTCRWGRFVQKARSDSASRSDDDVIWSCHQPELCPGGRRVLPDECEVCRYWEASAVPPCAAMGWADG